MAIHPAIANHFYKFIPRREQVLATIFTSEILGTETFRYCLTERRLAVLEKKNLFSWRYFSFGIENFTSVEVDEGLFKSKIILNDIDGEEVYIMNVGKKEAREFAAVFSEYIEQDHALLSQRTKVCPQCDEIVKFRAKRCKYCGYEFT